MRASRFSMVASVVVLLGGAAAFVWSQADDFSKVEVKAEKVAGTVSMLTGSGGNIDHGL